MERPLFAECDHLFRERPGCFRLGQGGLDPLMLDQTANLVGEQRFPMLGGATELHGLLLVSHESGLTSGYSPLLPAPLLPAPSALAAGVSTRPGSNFWPSPRPSCWS